TLASHHDPHQNQHSFPTRRSSDLLKRLGREGDVCEIQIKAHVARVQQNRLAKRAHGLWRVASVFVGCGSKAESVRARIARLNNWRSEEHTSELQSRFDLVCRLLLEKKN